MHLQKDQEDQFRMTVWLLGTQGCGTSTLMRVATGQSFYTHVCTTIDFGERKMEMGARKVKMQIWDNHGYERYRKLLYSHIRKAEGLILTYSITSRQTFANTAKMVEFIEQAELDYETYKPPIFLVGTHLDQQSQRTVSKQEGQRSADERGMKFFEVSSKTQEGIKEMLEIMAWDIFQTKHTPYFDSQLQNLEEMKPQPKWRLWC